MTAMGRIFKLLRQGINLLISGKYSFDHFLLRRILRTSTNLKKLDVRGLQRISPEGLQVHCMTNLLWYNCETKYL